jgi:transcriptional regulator with XRE-family HTH domain
MEKTAKVVQEIRAALRESQAQFAQRLNTTQAMVARWETGQIPTSDWIGKLQERATAVGLNGHAAELEGVLQRGRVRPKIEIQTEEELHEVNAVLRMLRNRGAYKSDFDALRKATRRARKDNADILAKVQAGVDIAQALINLRARGHNQAEIAEILGLDESIVSSRLAAYDLENQK